MKRSSIFFLYVFALLLIFCLVFNLSTETFAQGIFPSLPVIKTGVEYGSKYTNIFDEDIDYFIEYDYKNFQLQIVQQIFDKLFWNFKYKIQEYIFYDDFNKNKNVNYFYNTLKFKLIKNLIFAFDFNYKFLDFNIDSRDYNFLYPGISLKYNFKKSSYIYFSYHLYYRFGSEDYYDYQIHRFYFTLKYSLKKITFKINGCYNYQINFDEDQKKYNKFSVGAFITYDFNK